MKPKLLDHIDELLADPSWQSVFEARPNVEDVTFESLPAKYPEARTDLACGECGGPMQLIEGKFKNPFYGCLKFPECKGTHGAHANGAPLGIPADQATKRARIRAHEKFDQVWQQRLVRHRGAAYNWMRQVMGLSEQEGHIGSLSLQQCEELVRLVCRDYPSLKTSTDRLLYNDPLDDSV